MLLSPEQAFSARCACYVRRLPPKQAFSLRLGAHALSCPVYRESHDPADAAHDAEARYHLTGVGNCPYCEEDGECIGNDMYG